MRRSGLYKCSKKRIKDFFFLVFPHPLYMYRRTQTQDNHVKTQRLHPLHGKIHPLCRLNLINVVKFIHCQLNLIHSMVKFIHCRLNLIHCMVKFIHCQLNLIYSMVKFIHCRLNLIHSRPNLIPSRSRLNLIHCRLNFIN
jgi:hypothetical protein